MVFVRKFVFGLVAFLSFFLLGSELAYAYIGPGAGFAFLTSFLVMFVTILVTIIIIVLWPIFFLARLFLKKKVPGKGEIERVVIIGLDGLDPILTDKFMAEGKLPHFSNLKARGSYMPLQTTYPAMSPVAWSSFITGVTPARHNIFDFLKRDLSTYMPELSSSQVKRSRRNISLGKFCLPLGKPMIKSLRKSQPFWKILGDYGIFSAIIRVPITFPPERFFGVLLSGMCTPDLRGSQGTFSFYTTRKDSTGRHTGGVRISVTLEGNKIRSYIEGPENPFSRTGEKLRVPFVLTIDAQQGQVRIKVCGQTLRLTKGEYSPWVTLNFRTGLGLKIRGICRFYIVQISPDFELYVSPINIDPEKPALPISHPFIYSVYLSKLIGKYASLGLAEDTWALNEGVIDEKAFLQQCYLIQEEREKIFFKALEKVKKGLCVSVFDFTDRIQHMFYRYLVDDHPANNRKEQGGYTEVIEDLYRRADDLVGRVMAKIDNENTVLMVISDHGFSPFVRGVNLNSWLYRNGYLALQDGAESGEYFSGVDWSKTKAYTFGLGGLYINQEGREAKGIVRPGKETQQLKEELIQKLRGLKDEEKGVIAIKEVYDPAKLYSGPYQDNAPDLIVGYNRGYRTSWDAAVGKVNKDIFEDNTKRWSGDHCVEPGFVPGVFFSNRKFGAKKASIIDVAPTVLKLFGIEKPAYMEGNPLV
jgi:predicted AlkP superfamily phosphohydrolase/phosphomutase